MKQQVEDIVQKRIEHLEQQRDELLEALKGMRDIWQSTCDACNWDAHHRYQFTKCVAAITKAEESE